MTNNLVLACQPFSSLGKERVHAPPSGLLSSRTWLVLTSSHLLAAALFSEM